MDGYDLFLDRTCHACGAEEATSAGEVFEGATVQCQTCHAELVAVVDDDNETLILSLALPDPVLQAPG